MKGKDLLFREDGTRATLAPVAELVVAAEALEGVWIRFWLGRGQECRVQLRLFLFFEAFFGPWSTLARGFFKGNRCCSSRTAGSEAPSVQVSQSKGTRHSERASW